MRFKTFALLGILACSCNRPPEVPPAPAAAPRPELPPAPTPEFVQPPPPPAIEEPPSEGARDPESRAEEKERLAKRLAEAIEEIDEIGEELARVRADGAGGQGRIEPLEERAAGAAGRMEDILGRIAEMIVEDREAMPEE